MTVRSIIVVVMAALVAALTLFFRIPVPATGGYLNVGDVLVIFTGLYFGRYIGLLVGALGSAAADVFGGYASFAVVTLIVKGLEGYLAGALAGNRDAVFVRKLGAAVTAAAWMVLGYFIGETLMPGIGLKLATAEVVGNSFQGFAGAVGGLALYYAIRAAFQRTPPAAA